MTRAVLTDKISSADSVHGGTRLANVVDGLFAGIAISAGAQALWYDHHIWTHELQNRHDVRIYT
jgi:oligoribonuclease NrnB/cAMP/cGMP phosphodiesterase (DHH superfamily)